MFYQTHEKMTQKTFGQGPDGDPLNLNNRFILKYMTSRTILIVESLKLLEFANYSIHKKVKTVENYLIRNI